MLADTLPPVEQEVRLNKVAYDIDEVIYAVLLTLSDLEEIIVFRKKYSYFANRDIIRMVSGPLKGFEGRIYHTLAQILG